MKPRLVFSLLCLSVALNAVCVGLLVRPTATTSSAYPLISPRLFVQHPNDVIINFTALRKDLRTMVDTEKEFRTGVYFEYLPSGVSIGINEKEQFVTASLLKIPVIMGIFHLLEIGSIHSDQLITLKAQDIDSHFGTLWKRGVGATLTIDEAIHLAVTESDNTAALALDDLVPDDPVRTVYDSLDIPVIINDTQPVVTPKNYSSVLRCLYLSCYLPYAGSEKLLELMTQSIFTDAIPAGVPAGIRVAHKVGIYDQPGSTNRVRSDCGIVYAPRRPYILCIFGELKKGQETRLQEFVRKISSRVYRFVGDANMEE